MKRVNEKDFFFEILRVLAICCVIFNHTGNKGFSLFMVTGDEFEYLLSMILAVLCKVGVPLFFMISGALLVSKDEDILTVLRKRVTRIAIAIVLFSFVLYIRQYLQHPEYGFGLLYFAKFIYSKPFVTPYWFLYSYIAILILLPFLRRMARSMNRTEYFYLAIIGLIMGCIRPVFDYFLGAQMNLYLFTCDTNILFFLLGYGMTHVLEEQYYCRMGCIILQGTSGLSVIGSCIMIYISYKHDGTYSEDFIATFVLVQAVALFYTAKYLAIKNRDLRKTIPKWMKRGILCVGSCTFGIYLLEEILRTDLEGYVFKLCPPLPTLLVCMIYVAVVVMVGTIVVWVLKKIPGLNEIL